MRIRMYDPDGINPYGREVAVSLSELGHDVVGWIPRGTEWLPRNVRWHVVLPAHGLLLLPAVPWAAPEGFYLLGSLCK